MSNLDELQHTTREVKGGGNVLVLDTGAEIDPQAEAMLQALHSRSSGGIAEHLKKLEKRGAENFMETFYVGYGHKSIGDCGTCTIFVEDISMLAAKAIQDWPLYSGQESSTRYIDFSSQRFVDPLSTKDSETLLKNWRSFYKKGTEQILSHLKDKHPKKEQESKKKYEKAITALGFDIMRGFLPAGTATNIAWHSNLRQIDDKLLRLRNHPLEEVQNIAEAIEDAVMEAFPSSFSEKRYEKTENYYQRLMNKDYYFEKDSGQEFSVTQDSLDQEKVNTYSYLFSERPPHTELPKFLSECGTLQFEFLLDFGSFRDIQRHRAVTQRVPMVVTKHGFEQWYLENMPKKLREEAKQLLTAQENLLSKLDSPKETKQYYIPMGYKLPNRLTGDLPALIYLAELRATRHVHPTLSHKATQIANTIEEKIDASLHIDDEPRRFDVERGEHDIVDRTNN